MHNCSTETSVHPETESSVHFKIIIAQEELVWGLVTLNLKNLEKGNPTLKMKRKLMSVNDCLMGTSVIIRVQF